MNDGKRAMSPSRLTTHLQFILDLLGEATDETDRLGDHMGTVRIAKVMRLVAIELDEHGGFKRKRA